MGIYERMMQIDAPNIPVHLFVAVVAEHAKGNMTNNQARTALNLSAAEGNEAIALSARVQGGQLTRTEVHDVLLIAWDKHPPYDTVAAVKTRLGV